MAEIGGQQRKSSLGILAGPVPLHEGISCKTMAQVVQARPMAVGGTPQTDLPRQRIEGSMNLSAVQTIAPAGEEQVGGRRPSCPMAPASGEIVCQHRARRGV